MKEMPKLLQELKLVSDGPVEAQADCSRSSLDGANLRAGLEVLVSRPPTVLSMSVKPKQLDYDDIEEYSFSETFTPMLEAKRMDKSAGKRCCTILESAASPNELNSSNPDGKSSEKQSLVEQKVSNESGEALRGSFEDYVEECVEVESDGNVNSMLKSVEDNLEAALSIQHSHETVVLPNVDNGSGVEMNQNMKSLLSKGFESSPELQVQEGELGCDGRSETTLFTFKHEQLAPSVVSSLTKQATGDSQGCLVEEVGMADPTSIVVDSQNVLHLENKLDWGSALNMACSAKTMWERKSQLGEDGLSAYGSVGSPYSEDKNFSYMKLRELRFAKNSSPPERRLGPATQDSWPQFKRRKIESQQTNFFSASPSFRVQKLQSTESNPENRYLNRVEDNAEDALKFQYFPVSHEGDVKQSNVYKRPDVEIYQKGKCLLADGIGSSIKLQLEEDELGSEWRNKSTQPPSTFKHRQLGPSHVSSLSKEITGDSQVFLDEELETDDPISVVLDVKRGCNEQDCQGLLWSENNIDLGTTDDLTCTEKTLHERKFHLGKDDLFSYCLSGSPHKKHLDLISADQTMPVFEGFILDVQRENGQHYIAGDGISFDKLDLANATIERASVLEQLCKSVSMHTPLSHFSATFKSHRTPDLHESLPNGLLESMDPRSTLSLNGDGGRQIRASDSCVNEVNCAFEGVSDSDCLPYSNTRFGWSSEKPYTSPVGKLWERITSNSSSSEKQRSLNPEFTCFPIEEDPSFSEENENTDEVADTIQEDSGSIMMNSGAKREPLAEIAETCSNPPASVSAVKIFPDRGSLDSVNAEVSFTGTHNRVKQKLGNRYSNKRRCTDKAKENQTLSMGPNGIKKAPKSLNNRFSKPKLSGKTSLRKGGQSLSEREPRRNNIVSNITSFVPLVQQKQAATVCTGKRDIKVKALETAEAAKRLEEKREKERKMKKEALKLKRDRMEQEKMQQMELNKKKKEEEQKKKDANMAMRKRLREEGERKDNERKIKRIEEARRQQRERGEKLHAVKVEKEVQCGATDERVNSGKGSNDDLGKHQRMEKEKGDDNFAKNPETEVTEPRTAGISTSDVRQASIVLKDCEAGDTGKAMIVLDKSPENDNLVTNTNREKSYEISPYQCSDDEEEEEDDIPTRKFVPSWASKNCVVLVLSSQQKVDPDVIFPPGSFCSMDEVLLPRKLQLK
ncbi:hypothetical protein F0562_009965 [Nyssa sinensis]|uniref:Inner centromere protein ARK-binding domain-containing protein n=1 Tax=Nyssa sinensis TaxID=561372 RepID=A0A5J5A1B1_9ASTE|nr:hypothetical protein F0562_009965 [Nyssa sinensis]